MSVLKCILEQKAGFLKYKSGLLHVHKIKTQTYLRNFILLTSRRIEHRTIGHTGKNSNGNGRTEFEIIYRYLPEETDKNRENVYIRQSDTAFKIRTVHHHRAERYRYSNLLGESVPFSNTDFSLLEKNTAVGTNFSSPNCRPDLGNKQLTIR